jgi:predicted nucleic acid-binding protein
MRVLLDTNILIHREAAIVIRDDIGVLFNWLDRLHCTKCVHPESIAELQRHEDEKVRASFMRKLAAYQQLKTPAAMRADVQAVASRHDTTANDAVDSALLNEVAAGTVDMLVSEDRKVLLKARELGLADKALSIEALIERCVAENPDLVDYSVLAVRRVHFGAVPVDNEFFDSFRNDYHGFDAWYARKTDEPAYVCHEGEDLAAFLYLKVEDAREPYPDITPQMPSRRRLKIGTFKVTLNGFRLGERFLKIIFDNAVRQQVDEVYVTVFRGSPEKERLVGLLEEFGFRKFGEKRGSDGVEDVFVRSMLPGFDSGNPRSTFPFISRSRPWYIVPIYPKYHTSLLPDSILKTESAEEFVDQEPHRNAIRKVYICRSLFRKLEVGDAIVFYRTGGYHRSVVTSIGVVDAVHRDICKQEHFVSLCRQRSVFSDAELRRHWNYKTYDRPFIVEFLYTYAFPKRPNMAALIEAGVIADVKSAPRGFERLSDKQVAKIFELAEADTRLVVD